MDKQIIDYLKKHCLWCLYSRSTFKVLDEDFCHICCKDKICQKEHWSYPDFQIAFYKMGQQ